MKKRTFMGPGIIGKGRPLANPMNLTHPTNRPNAA